MAAQYTYLCTDLRTNRVLGEVFLGNVSLDCQLNTAGNMTAGLSLNDYRMDDSEVLTRTQPGRTAFWVYRESVIVWGGIIWSREYQSNGKAITITGQTFESYAAKRFPRSSLQTANVKYNGVEQTKIIDDLWHQMQRITGGDIKVQLMGSYPPANNGKTRYLKVRGWDLSMSYDDIIQSLVQRAVDAPDYTIRWKEDGNGLPLKVIQSGINLGDNVNVTNLVVDYPGQIADYIYTENSASGANRWWAIGSGNFEGTIVGSQTDSTQLDAGYPLIEMVNSYTSDTTQDAVSDHSETDLKNFPNPLITHQVDLNGTGYPPFGTYKMGDFLIANIIDNRFPGGRIFKKRAIGWTISPPDTSNGTETISPVFDEPGSTGS
jgi:hypothetical protein